MGDEFICPECDDYLQMPNRCVCGWRLDKRSGMRHNVQVPCARKFTEGTECANPPTVMVGNSWLCRQHAQEEMFGDCRIDYQKLAKSRLDEIYAVLGVKRKVARAN